RRGWRGGYDGRLRRCLCTSDSGTGNEAQREHENTLSKAAKPRHRRKHGTLANVKQTTVHRAPANAEKPSRIAASLRHTRERTPSFGALAERSAPPPSSCYPDAPC